MNLREEARIKTRFSRRQLERLDGRCFLRRECGSVVKV